MVIFLGSLHYSVLIATAGLDYSSVFLSVFFANSSVSHCVNIVILDDNIVEGFDTFSIVLSSSTRGVVLSPNATLVTIVDDPGENHFHMHIQYTAV